MRIAILANAEQVRQASRALVGDGHACCLFETSRAFLKAFKRDTFDLLLLDWDLPRAIRDDAIATVCGQRSPRVPVVLLIRRADMPAAAGLLGRSVADIVGKPTDATELSMRVRAIQMRAWGNEDPQCCIWEPYRFIPRLQSVEVGGSRVRLTHKEFDLAMLFFQSSGRALSRDYIVESVWPHVRSVEHATPSRTLDTHIARIRKQLSLRMEHGYTLRSLYGRGYRLDGTAREKCDPSLPCGSRSPVPPEICRQCIYALH